MHLAKDLKKLLKPVIIFSCQSSSETLSLIKSAFDFMEPLYLFIYSFTVHLKLMLELQKMK